MKKDTKTIKQCILIGQSLNKDYQNGNVFTKIMSTSAIDLTLNWLAENQIEEVFLFYSKSKKQIEEYYQKTQKYQEIKKIHLLYMKPQEMKTFGDVVREVQFRNLISQDFLIMFADTIANFDLVKMTQTHFKKKTELKNVMVTSALQKEKTDKIHIYNPKTCQILQLDQDNNASFTINKERVDLKKMNVEFRRDLSHCQIYICTIEILKIFKETFEYSVMYDFINGMLTSDVYEDKFVGYILGDNEKAYRINRSYYYYKTYLHYICRHFAPYTIYNRVRIGKGKKEEPKDFMVKNFNKVLMRNSIVGKNTELSHNIYIGYETTVGDFCKIDKSIIGNACKIGNEVVLKNCIVLDNCQISSKSIYENCLIEKVNESLNIKSFISEIVNPDPELISESLFPETPENQNHLTLDEELTNLLSDDPRQDQFEEVTQELYSVRKRFNLSLKQFTHQVILKLQPRPNQVKQFIGKWGKILYLLHENQELLLYSLLFSCQAIAKYQKALAHFVKNLYEEDFLDNFDYHLKKWYNEAISKEPNNLSLLSCKPLIESLEEEDESEDEDSD